MDRSEEGPIIDPESMLLGFLGGSLLTVGMMGGYGIAIQAVLFMAGLGILADATLHLHGQYILSGVASALIGFAVTFIITFTTMLALYTSVMVILALIVYFYKYMKRQEKGSTEY